MLSLGSLAFAAPWALAAAGLLPVLWWLRRVVPPAPRQVRFPAIRLLFGLEGREDASARTPWWVLLLRLALVLLVILAAAHPLLDPARPRGGGPRGTPPSCAYCCLTSRPKSGFAGRTPKSTAMPERASS